MHCFIIMFVFVVSHSVSSAPVSLEFATRNYLTKFGYLPTPSPRSLTAGNPTETLSEAVKRFQRFAGLQATGFADSGTVRMMTTPRCSVLDNSGAGANRGPSTRYALAGSRWPRKNLTWSLTEPSYYLSRTVVEAVISKALKLWSDNADLKFAKYRESPSTPGRGKIRPDIEIIFTEGDHNDGDPFDGHWGVLAHANYPRYGGDVHMDDAEHWTTDGKGGTNLYQVIAHEFGHALGLSHSSKRSSLMTPFYHGYDPNLRLDGDDIAAIQALYGPPNSVRLPNLQYV